MFALRASSLSVVLPASVPQTSTCCCETRTSTWLSAPLGPLEVVTQPEVCPPAALSIGTSCTTYWRTTTIESMVQWRFASVGQLGACPPCPGPKLADSRMPRALRGTEQKSQGGPPCVKGAGTGWSLIQNSGQAS